MLLSSAHTQSFGIKSNAPKKPKLIPRISATDLSRSPTPMRTISERSYSDF